MMGFTSFVLMVEPISFFVNRITALDNKCQPTLGESDLDVVEESNSAMEEHRTVARRLRDEYFVDVVVVPLGSGACAEDLGALSRKPDAIFPNNSISFHVTAANAATVVLYPMSPGRVGEVPRSILTKLSQSGPDISVCDLRTSSSDQDHTAAMEGTGAVNITTDGSAMFVGISKRASPELIPVVQRILKITQPPLVFHATDADGVPIYHTNVVGWLGSGVCAWCFESMTFGGSSHEEEMQRKEAFVSYVRDVVCRGDADKMLSLTREQALTSFCGNCLEVQREIPLGNGSDSKQVVPLLCMSSTAWRGYTAEQQQVLLEHYGGESNIARFDIPTIERLGGGSVRCLLAASGPLPDSRTDENSVVRHFDLFRSLVSPQL